MKINPFLLILTAFVALVITLPAAHATNLILNGGFETGDFTDWTLSGQTDHTYVGNDVNAPHSGSYAAQLGAVGGDNTLSQLINTVAGTSYTVDYWHIYAPDAGPVGNFSVLWDGTTIHSEITQDPPTPQVWTEYSFLVTGTGSDTLAFMSRNDPSYQALDDVSVTVANAAAVPLPSGVILFMTALLGLLCMTHFARSRIG